MQQQKDKPKLISAIVPVAGFPNGTTQIDSWTKAGDLSNFEIIFVNDSDDAMVEKKLQEIAAYLSTNSKVKILKSNHRNPGGARNLGLSNADGSWFVFWDCDDIPDPLKVRQMIFQAEKENSSVTFGAYRIRSSAPRNLTVKRVNEGQNPLDSVAINPGLWRFAFKAETTKKIIFPELSMAEDQIFLAKILTKPIKLSYFDEVVYEYWDYPVGQLTKNQAKIQELNVAIDYFYQKYESAKCQQLLIVIVRLTATAIKRLKILGKLVLLAKFLRLIISHPGQIKNIFLASSVIRKLK